MQEEKTYVSTRPIGGKQDAAGIGFVMLPSGYDEEQYIEHCYRSGTVSILMENGGILIDVIIAKHALNEIDFPSSSSTLGSQVIWVSQPRRKRPIIIGHVNKSDEFVSYSKNKSSLRRATGGSVNEVIVDSKKGVVIINSNSSGQAGGDIYILATNKMKSAKFNIQVGGDINVLSTNFLIENSGKFYIKIKDLDIDKKITEISYEKTKGLSYKDEFGNEGYINKENIQFKPASKFNIGKGKEPLMLGNTTQKELQKDSILWKALLQVLKTPINEPGNGSPSAFQAALLAALSSLSQGDYSEILSKISNTD